MDNLEIEQLLFQGNCDKALQLVETWEKEEKITLNDRLMYNLLKSHILREKGDYTESLKVAKHVLKESKEQEMMLYQLDAYIAMVGTMEWIGEFDKGLTVIEQSENVLSTLIEETAHILTQRKASVAYFKGRFLWKTDKADKALEFFEKSLELWKEIDIKTGIADSFRSIGNVFIDKNDNDRALEYYQKSLTLYETIGNKIGMALAFNNIGIIYKETGNFKRALEYFQQSLALCEEFDNKTLIFYPLYNIGAIYLHKGDFDRALECYQQCMIADEEVGNKYHMAKNFKAVGEIYRQKGDLELAVENYQQGLQLSEELNNNPLISKFLFMLISIAIERNQPVQAQEFLEKLELTKDQEENKWTNLYWRVSKALILKTSPKIRDKAQAQELFQRIIEDDIPETDTAFNMAMLNLCELLLDEFKAFGEHVVFEEAEVLVQKYFTLAQKSSSFSVMVDALMLKAKFAMVKGNLTRALKFLEQAESIAEEYSLGRMIEKVTAERQQLEDQYDLWQNFIQTNVTFQTRLEQVRLSDYIRVAQQRVTMSEAADLNQ